MKNLIVMGIVAGSTALAWAGTLQTTAVKVTRARRAKVVRVTPAQRAKAVRVTRPQRATAVVVTRPGVLKRPLVVRPLALNFACPIQVVPYEQCVQPRPEVAKELREILTQARALQNGVRRLLDRLGRFSGLLCQGQRVCGRPIQAAGMPDPGTPTD